MLLSTPDKKRVYCLYRVSTIGQVEKDDIPMQKQFCRDYCQRQSGWEIVKEFSEKGVSGFKVSAKDRDAIQEIQRAAIAREFDILLVFMFDRLGHRDDETPFVVEWFVKNGIEVWSAMEGQQRFDTHVDKLLNYIRYWQASGESIKTSMRVKTRMEQLTQEGHYTGGIVPFGYRLEKKGRLNKKNQAVGDLAVEPDEAEIVKLIFEKYVTEGYGSQRICRFLAEKGVKNKKGRNIPTTSVPQALAACGRDLNHAIAASRLSRRIIKNPLYTGVIHNGDCTSELIPELQIIDEATFQRAQELMGDRLNHHSNVPLNTSGRSLLVGNVYCGHCGGRLTLTTSGRKYVRKDGTTRREVRARYQCHYNVRHPGECDGQSGYGVDKLDGLIDKIIRMQFERIRDTPPQAVIEQRKNKETDFTRARVNLLKEQYDQKQKDYQALRAETVRVIQGLSKLNVTLLNDLLTETEDQIKLLERQIAEAEAELVTLSTSADQIQKEYEKLMTWADLYDNCTFEAKKMLIAQFVKAVYVRRDYEISIEFNVSFEEFQQLYLEKETGENKMPGAETLLTFV